MKRFYFLLLLTITGLTTGNAQSEQATEPTQVLGTHTHAELLKTIDAEWLATGTEVYEPNPTTTKQIATAIKAVDEIVVFYGSWCGDSRRELPKMIKTLTAAGYPLGNVRFVGVDKRSATYKKSPDGAADGKQIYRVPTFVFSRDGREFARMIEQPTISMEYDLLTLLTTDDYQPAYPALARVAKLDAAGLLSDPNVTGRNLRMELAPLLSGPRPLNGVAYVLLAEGRVEEAIKLLYVNVLVFPEDANGYDSLAEALAQRMDYANAVAYQRKALTLDPGGKGYQERYDEYLRKVPE